MDAGERLPDEALVVRGGRRPLHEGCDEHPEGVYGFSVQCAAGVSLDDLASALPHGTIAVTTVGEIRSLGYDVVVTRGAGHHATVVVPRDFFPADAEGLARTFREGRNPRPRRPR